MKDRTASLKQRITTAVACVAIAAVSWSTGNLCNAQTQTVSLPPGVQDIVKLAHAGISEDVMMAQIKSAGASYNLNADQIIYLNSQGVSQSVIQALLPGGGPAVPAAPSVATAPLVPAAPTIQTAPLASPAPVAAPLGMTPGPAGSTVSYDSFHGQLAPHCGSWIQLNGYGSCWRPTIAAQDPAWRPYCDAGHWIYTDTGWCWQSDYPWGDIPFHYGRWLRSDLGWVWVPGYDWAPAWVSWRRNDRYCGWAPLPPAAVFKAGIGLTFGGQVAVDADFGLGPEAFTFVGYDHFWEHDFRAFILPRELADPVFRASFVLNGYRLDHGRFIVEGLGRDAIGTLTRHEVRLETPGFHDDRTIRRPEDARTPIRDGRRGPDDRRDRPDR